MTIVAAGEEDGEVRRRLLVEHVLPRWIERCGQACVQAWNRHQAKWSGLRLSGPDGGVITQSPGAASWPLRRTESN